MTEAKPDINRVKLVDKINHLPPDEARKLLDAIEAKRNGGVNGDPGLKLDTAKPGTPDEVPATSVVGETITTQDSRDINDAAQTKKDPHQVLMRYLNGDNGDNGDARNAHDLLVEVLEASERHRGDSTLN